MSKEPGDRNAEGFALNDFAKPPMTTATPKPRAGEHSPMCIWDDCDQDAIYCEGHAREFMLTDIDTCVRDLLDTLGELVTRCDGAEGVRADGSNIQTMQASALLSKHRR